MAKKKPTPPGVDLRVFQEKVAKWAQDRWPDRTDYEDHRDLPFYRLVSTAGNMSAAVAELAVGVLFDAERDLRVDPDVCREELRRGLGKLVIWATEFASRNGWSISVIVEETWAELKEEEDDES